MSFGAREAADAGAMPGAKNGKTRNIVANSDQ